MPVWKSDSDLFSLMRRELFTAVVGDILDTLGYLHQFLAPNIKPLHDDMVVLGRAMPVLEVDIPVSDEKSHNEPGQKPFGLMLEALDDLKPGEVYIAGGGSSRYALWGELMSTRASYLGAAGAVLDGYSRDTRGILKLGFPTFSIGRFAQDQAPRGKVIDFRISIECGGIRVQPGDIVFGDLDGVVVIPHEVEVDTLSKALDKVRNENRIRNALQQGMSTREAFDKYGVM